MYSITIELPRDKSMQLQSSVVQHRTKPYSALDISFLAGCKSSMHACTSNTEVEITSPRSCVQLAPLYTATKCYFKTNQ